MLPVNIDVIFVFNSENKVNFQILEDVSSNPVPLV